MLPGGQAGPAGIDAGQVAVADLVMQQAGGQCGQVARFAGGAGQPSGIRVWFVVADNGEAVPARSQAGLAVSRSPSRFTQARSPYRRHARQDGMPGRVRVA